jgi:Uma2 family endonuclease
MQTVAEPFVYISLETFERLAAENDLMRLERGPDGRLIALPPTGTMSGFRGSELVC